MNFNSLSNSSNSSSFLLLSTRSSTTAVGDHLRNTRHGLDLSSSSIVVRENDTFKTRIREAIEIHSQALTLNCDIGYELLAIM